MIRRQRIFRSKLMKLILIAWTWLLGILKIVEDERKWLVEDERQGLPSASSWRRYELCSGSFQLEQEAKRLGQEAYAGPSSASARGERIHAVLSDEEVELKEGEAVTAEFLAERADDQVKRIFGDLPVKELKEQRLWLKLDGRLAASGRFDRVVYSGHLALVQDFKTGWAPPDPAEINAQLKFLSVLVAMNLAQITEVVAQIISGPYGVSETRFDLGALARAYNDVAGTLRKLADPQASFSPSPQACRYCPATAICQPLKDLILPIARLQHSALPDGNRAAKLLDECDLLERHLEAIRAHYSERLGREPDYTIPGWGMEQGPPRRTVTDWHLARKRLEEFIDPSLLDQNESYRLGAVEKALGQTLKVKGNELKAKLGEILSGLIEEKYPAKILKRLKGSPQVTTLTD